MYALVPIYKDKVCLSLLLILNKAEAHRVSLQDPSGLSVLERLPGGERGPLRAGLGGLLHVLPDLPPLRQHLRRLPHARFARNVGEGLTELIA